MSVRTPSVKVLEREYVTRRIRTSGVTADMARAEFHRTIAEVEDAAAEKGYGAGIRDAEQFYQSHMPAYGKAPLPMPVNPYRRNEGENE